MSVNISIPIPSPTPSVLSIPDTTLLADITAAGATADIVTYLQGLGYTVTPPATGGVQVSSFTLSANTVAQGATLSATVTYTNTGGASVTLANIIIAGRPPGGTNLGGPWDDFTPIASGVTLAAGASYTLVASRVFTTADPTGVWYSFPTYQDSAGTWHDAGDGVAETGIYVDFTVTAAPTPVSSTGRVTRTGNQTFLNGQPIRLVGLDMWEAAITSWNHPACYEGWEPATATNLAGYLASIQATAPNVNALRVWFCQQYANDAGTRNWSAFDTVLSACHAAGIMVIACLVDNWSYQFTDTQGPGYPASWFSTGYKTAYTSPWETEPYRSWVSEVVTHYAGDERIAIWELGNELNNMTSAFAADVSGLIKSIDPGTLVSDGSAGGAPGITVSTMDFASFHYYTDYDQTNWKTTCTAAVAAGKASYIGECGFDGSGATRANSFASLLSTVFPITGMIGFLAWQWWPTADGGQFHISAGDPVLPVLNEYA
jgi:Cellulase (glycosyl hydrolase family 5)